MKKALITGITGQDGSYLTEFLLAKNYEVHGIVRRCSSVNRERIDHLWTYEKGENPRLFLHYGDLADAVSLVKLVYELQPDEVYNLGAQSHVGISFSIPEYTLDVTATGTGRLLESIREAGLDRKVRFYQASSSEMFGRAQEVPQTERTSVLSPFTLCLREGVRLLASPSTIAKRTICMLATESCSITSPLDEARTSLRARSPGPSGGSKWGFRRSWHWVTWRRSAIGDSRGSTLRPCG